MRCTMFATPARLPRSASVRVGTLAALAALTACGPLVQIGGNDKAPASLLALRATAVPATPSATTTDVKATVLVLVPAVPGTLQTLRLPVITTDTTVAYLAGATWAEQPNREFQRVIADTIAARGIAVLDPRQSTAASGRTLSGTLLDFSLDVRNPAAATVRVRFDAALTGVATKGVAAPFAVRRFDASVPVATQNPTDVATALNTAANTVAADVAAWIAR